VIHVVDEPLECRSVLFKDAFGEVRRDLLAIAADLPLWGRLREIRLVFPVLIELLSKRRLLAPAVPWLVPVGEQRLERLEVPLESTGATYVIQTYHNI